MEIGMEVKVRNFARQNSINQRLWGSRLEERAQVVSVREVSPDVFSYTLSNGLQLLEDELEEVNSGS